MLLYATTSQVVCLGPLPVHMDDEAVWRVGPTLTESTFFFCVCFEWNENRQALWPQWHFQQFDVPVLSHSFIFSTMESSSLLLYSLSSPFCFSYGRRSTYLELKLSFFAWHGCCNTTAVILILKHHENNCSVTLQHSQFIEHYRVFYPLCTAGESSYWLSEAQCVSNCGPLRSTD